MAGSTTSEDGDFGFQIAPMVDVVFVLLLFFMAAAGSQVIEKELSVNVPGGQRDGSQPNVIVVDIAADGTVSVNDQVYALPADRSLSHLRGWLKGIIADYGDHDPMILRPSPDTRQERIIDVLDACAAEKVKMLSFG